MIWQREAECLLKLGADQVTSIVSNCHGESCEANEKLQPSSEMGYKCK